MNPVKIYACWVYVSDLQKSKLFYQSIGFQVKLRMEIGLNSISEKPRLRFFGDRPTKGR